MKKILIMMVFALGANVNALDFKAGVDFKNTQHDIIDTAYIQASHQFAGLVGLVAIESESDKAGTDANQNPKISKLWIGDKDKTFKFGRQKIPYGIHQTNFINKHAVFDLTAPTDDGLLHTGKFKEANYSVFYSKDNLALNLNKDFTVGDFKFNIGGSTINNGSKALYASGRYGDFSFIGQIARTEHRVTTKYSCDSKIAMYRNSGGTNVDTKTVNCLAGTYTDLRHERHLELSYHIGHKIVISANTAKSINIGGMLTKNIGVVLERQSNNNTTVMVRYKISF
jgi:hypothetical protein